ncbi:MAG: SRPBCC domain-containing protein [Alphaproteobacteria bacterium]|nr:SRPBCC domain-containing protein [Alphaproteobacteria bacterium]
MSLEFVRSEPGDDPIIVEGYFAVAPAQVFQAWTDPDIVMKWFGRAPNSLHAATIDLRPGGAWQFLELGDAEKSVGFEGEYLDIEPGERLVFTWSKVIAHASGDRDATPTSQVEVTFTANGRGTDVRLVHSAVHDEPTRRGFGGGWSFAFGTMSALLSEKTT